MKPTLKEVKQLIWSTDCARYLLDGLYRSEPIFAKDAYGLIDVYFTYGRNREATEYVAPLVTFGIYYDNAEVAFVFENDSPSSERCDTPGPQAHPEKTVAEYEELESLYPIVRSCAFSCCDERERAAVSQYCAILEKVSGPILWDRYQKASPEFFKWANSLVFLP